MPISRGWRAIALVSCLLFPALGPAQTSAMTLRDLETLMEEIVGDVAAERHDEAAQKMGRLGDAFRPEDLRKSFQGFAPLGKPLYSDKIVDRSYGNSGKDVIYKIAYQQNMLFARFIIHRQRDGWTVYNFAFQTENQAPLPRAWPHVYP